MKKYKKEVIGITTPSYIEQLFSDNLIRCQLVKTGYEFYAKSILPENLALKLIINSLASIVYDGGIDAKTRKTKAKTN